MNKTSTLGRISIGKGIFFFALFALMLFPILTTAMQSIAMGLLVFGAILSQRPQEVFSRLKDKEHLKTYFLLCGFFLLTLLSGFWSSDTQEFSKTVQSALGIAILPLVVAFFPNEINDKKRHLLYTLFIAGLLIYIPFWYDYLVTGISIYQEQKLFEHPINDFDLMDQFQMLYKKGYKGWAGGYAILGHQLNGGTSFFSHYSYISSFFSFGIFLCVYLLKNAKMLFSKVLAIIALPFLGALLWYMPSTHNKLVLGLVGIYAVFQFFKKKWHRIGVLLILITVVSVLGFGKMKAKLKSITSIEVLESKPSNFDGNIVLDFTRVNLYKCATNIAKDNWAFGIGLGDIKSSINECTAQQANGGEGLQDLNTHSQFIHFLLSGGILNLLLFLLFFLFLFKKAYSEQNITLFFFLLILFLNCCFENYLSRVWGVLFAYVFIIIIPTWKHTNDLISKNA